MKNSLSSNHKKSKRILLRYYSKNNLGDDLFIQLAAKQLINHKIYLLVVPIYKTPKIPENVKILTISSWICAIIGKLISLINGKSAALSDFLDNILTKYNHFLSQRYDAHVMIGGSIFIDSSKSTNEYNFSVPPDQKRDFSIKIKLRNNQKKNFIIGANFGPCYNKYFLKSTESALKSQAAVTVRDYATYKLFSHLENVQYAPDVVFLHTPEKKHLKSDGKKHIFISPIDASSWFTPSDANHYYNLMTDTIKQLLARGLVVDLVSFCDAENDMIAIDKILSNFSNKNNINIHSYSRDLDIDKITDLVAQSEFVIATRFHSMILGFIYEKPTFPIIYNCKTYNYLTDLNFSGKYAHYNCLSDTTVDDVLYNYDNNIICDISDHKKYAENQFYAIKKFLNEDFD